MNKTKFLATLLLCAAMLPGCSKEPAATEQKAAGSAPDPETPVAAAEAPKAASVASVAKADRSKPLASYQELGGGRGLMFAYLAVSTLPVDYEKVAAVASSDYAVTSDEFRKRDLMKALKPGIDAEIEKAKEKKYYYMTVGGELDKYDFDNKSFRHRGFVDPTSQIYFQGTAYRYKLNFVNSEQFKQVVVTDEAKARQIETLRATGYSNIIATRVYFFASSAELGEPVVKAEIVKIQLMDLQGNILLEM